MGYALLLILVILAFGLAHFRVQYRYKAIVKDEREKNSVALDNYKAVAEKTKRKLNEKTIQAKPAHHH